MEYFLSHIGYIVILSVILALLAFAWSVMAQYNEKRRDRDNEKWDVGENGCHTAERCKD